MSYITVYKIYNKSDNSTIFLNKNTACFAEFANVDSKGKILGFYPERAMKVYNNLSDLKSTDESLIKYWIDILNDLNMKITYEKVNLKESKEELPARAKPEHAYVYTFDFADYTSKAHLRFALHMMRYLYEENMWKVIDKTKKLNEEKKDIDPFELFQYVCMFEISSGGHALWYHRIPKEFITKDVLFSYFDEWKNAKRESLNEINFMLGKFDIYNKLFSNLNNLDMIKHPKYQLYDELRKGVLVGFEKYKEILKILLK